MQNNILFEMLPLIVFFSVYYFTKNIYLATAVIIAVSWLQLIYCQIKLRFVTKNTWISTILITIFGGLTIILHNKTFVMLKPSILYWIIGSSMLVSQAIGKNGIKLLLHKELTLPDIFWNRINSAWAIFFLIMGGLNLFVALNFSEYVWVKFKVFGSLGLTILFMLITATYVYIAQKKHKG